MNRTSKSIKRFYQSINIHGIQSLSIDNIINCLGLDLYYWDEPSCIVFYGGKYTVFINGNIPVQQQWQDFGHEMSHYFYDRINRKNINDSFVDYCEAKADYFAYHFCVPTFMLQKIKGVDVYDVMRLFNVEFDFALRRLEMYYNKCLSRRKANVL